MTARVGGASRRGATGEKIVRHALVDRVVHWASALGVLVLLGTGFLPILGVEFAWVAVHWMAGVVLTGVVLLHAVRSLFWKSLRAMWLGARDVGYVLGVVRWSLRRIDTPPALPGKYSPAQKLIHHAFALAVLVTIVTGIVMMVKVETPFWERNPYFLDNVQWGIVHVLHGLAALVLITMVMAHVYFALRPEKRLFLRSMMLGWITRDELERYHDTNRWRIGE